MNRYNDPKDSPAFAEKREYVNLTPEALSSFWDRVEKGEGCWPWKGGKFTEGYGDFRFAPNGIRMKAHRASFLISRGYLVDCLFVCHKCDNPECVRPDHLFLGTPDDNMKDKAKKGRAPKGDLNPARVYSERLSRGSNHYRAVVTEEMVNLIRKACDSGMTYYSASKAFGVSSGATFKIGTRRSWRHVPEYEGSGFQR